jgi:holo-[acyl-carrier protein] synthase
MKTLGVGIDAVEIKRFAELVQDRQHPFWSNNFSKNELDHCFAFQDPTPHLAGTFAAKEAVSKALDASQQALSEIEIAHLPSGAPQVSVKNQKRPDILISITHIETTATAIAIVN